MTKLSSERAHISRVSQNFETLSSDGHDDATRSLAAQKSVSEEAFFLNSASSVLKKDLPQLRRGLRESILKISSDSELGVGDHVAKINLSFY